MLMKIVLIYACLLGAFGRTRDVILSRVEQYSHQGHHSLNISEGIDNAFDPKENALDETDSIDHAYLPINTDDSEYSHQRHPNISESIDHAFDSKDTNLDESESLDHAYLPINKDDSEAEEIVEKQINCGVQSIKPNSFLKIVGGEEALPHSWPWIISLQYYTPTLLTRFCGGTIINSNTVISAAHCLFDDNDQMKTLKNLYTVAGIHNILESYSNQAQRKKVIYYVIHPNYQPSDVAYGYDIAVLRTDYFTFNRNVQPACLPNKPVLFGTYCYAAGWGTTSENGVNAKELHQVRIPVISHETCVNWMGNKIKPSMLCAGYPNGGRDSCQGDSGGPLLCQRGDDWNLYGVVSWGRGCGKPGNPGVYTSISSFLQFIRYYAN